MPSLPALWQRRISRLGLMVVRTSYCKGVQTTAPDHWTTTNEPALWQVPVKTSSETFLLKSFHRCACVSCLYVRVFSCLYVRVCMYVCKYVMNFCACMCGAYVCLSACVWCTVVCLCCMFIFVWLPPTNTHTTLSHVCYIIFGPANKCHNRLRSVWFESGQWQHRSPQFWN